MQAAPWKLRIRLCWRCLGCLDEFRSSCLCPFLLQNLCEEKVRQTKITNDSDTSASPRTALHSFRQLRSRCDLWLSSLRRWPGLVRVHRPVVVSTSQHTRQEGGSKDVAHRILGALSVTTMQSFHSQALASHLVGMSVKRRNSGMDFFGANLDIGAKACLCCQIYCDR